MPTSNEKFTKGAFGGKKRKPKKKEVAGPYRSQSSNPKIRSEATESEHRKAPVKPKDPFRVKGFKRYPEKAPLGEYEGYGSGKKAGDDFPDLSPVLDALKRTYEGNKITGNPGKDFVEEEARTVAKAVTDSIERAKSGEGHLRTPSKEQAIVALELAGLKGAGKAATAGEKALTKATAAASDASWAKTAASKVTQAAKAAPKKKVARIKSAPKRAAKRVKETPQRVRTAPRRAKKAASTPEGRRAAAKGTGRKAARHPFASVGGAGVLANQSGADIPGLKEAGAFVEGTVAADPWKSAKTTARSVPGLVLGPAALIGSAASSVVSGSPKPLEEEATKQVKGLIDIGGKLLSGDPETVKKATEDEVGYSFVVPIPAASRLRKTKVYKQGRGKLRKAADRPRARKRTKAREAVRQAKLENRVVSGKQAKRVKKTQPVIDSATGEAYALPGLGRKIENRRGRVNTSRELARTKSSGEIEARRAQAKIVKEIRKSKLSKGEHNVGDVLATVAQYGISRDKAKGLKQLDAIERSIGKSIDPDAIPSGIVNDLANIRWIRENADAFFTDKHFWKAADEYKARAAEISTSQRKENLAVGDVYGVKRPEERMADGVVIPGDTETVTSRLTEPLDRGTREAAAKAILRRDRKLAKRGQRAAGRTARRRAATGAYMPDVDSIRTRDWYHGTGTKGLSPDKLEGLGTDPLNLFGQGVYLTSKPGIAKGYSKVRKGSGKTPTVYKARVNPNRVLDLEGTADPRFTNALAEVAASIERTHGESVITDALGAALVRGERTNAEIYSAFRKAVMEFAHGYGWSRSDLFDSMQELNGKLRAEGWDALTHKGGGRTGHKPHQVLIVLDPRDIAGSKSPNPIVAFSDRKAGGPQPPERLPLSRVPTEQSRTVTTVRPKKIKVQPYKQLETYERKRAELAELTSDIERLRAAKKDLNPEQLARAEKLDAELTAQRKAKEAADAEYVAEVQGVIKREGLEQPAYVRDVRPRAEGEVLPAYYKGKPSSRPHMADIEQARRGVEIDRSFKTLMDQSVGAPRLREHFHAATTNFVERNAQTVNGQRYVTSEQFARAVERGDVDPSQFAMMPAQQFKRAVLDPHKNAGFTDDLNASLRGELQAKANQPGNKYAVVPKEALREFVHQFEPPKGLDKALGPPNRFFTRAILGYSPGWAAAQVIAEGIPTAVSVGTNPARWARIAKYLAREEKRLSRKDKAVIDGTFGESPGVTPQPRTQLTTTMHRDSARAFQLMERNAVGRSLLKVGKGEVLGGFDRWKGGKYRKVVALAKADRELNGALTSMRELMRGQRRVSEAIKGKPLKAQMEWMARHPAELAKLEGHLDNVMGNWRAMTRLESKFAPAIVFYPFLRYSLRWTFWSFPKEHPVKAQILYFLSQQNAEELEKIIGGPPANPVDYTFPVFTNSDGEDSVMPGGQRFAPGMNAITTAIGKGRIETTASGLNPVVGLGYTLLSGNDPFTGEKVASSPLENGLLALNQLLSMPAPLRVTLPESVPVVGGSTIRDTITEALGDEPPSDVSKAFREMDPNREARSFYNPLAPQPAGRYKDSVTLSKALEESGWDPELGEDVVTQAVLAARKGDRKLVKELIRKRESSEKASDEIGRLIREYVSDPEQLPKFTDRDWKVVNEITGKMVIPYEPPKTPKQKLEAELGVGGDETPKQRLEEELGLGGNPKKQLEEELGL